VRLHFVCKSGGTKPHGATFEMSDDCRMLPNQVLSPDASSFQALSAILHAIGASEFMQSFIDDDQNDDNLVALSVTKPERIVKKYGLSWDLANAFVQKCRMETSLQHSPQSSAGFAEHPFSSRKYSSMSSNPRFAEAAPTQDAVTVLRELLQFEVIGKLGEGAFGKVFKCKNQAEKRSVAVKFVDDPLNSKEAIREGQRLVRCSHLNIVRLFKVHDLGNGMCALEMEAVPGGDLSSHIEAARRRSGRRLPQDAILRFTRQLLQALLYLHEEMKMLHGDIKPQNILLQCDPDPGDGSSVDYSDAGIKLADFGLAKMVAQSQNAAMSFMVSNASSRNGNLKGTMWYLSPQAIQGANASSGHERCFADDLWSACLVILEMDAGLPLNQLMTSPGSVKLHELLTVTSPQLLPVLCTVLSPNATPCGNARELLQILDASINPLFEWQLYEESISKFVPVCPAAAYVLEISLAAGATGAHLPLAPPLDFVFDISALRETFTALGNQKQLSTGISWPIRRILRLSALSDSGLEIPIWQQFISGMEWKQISPAGCAKYETELMKTGRSPDVAEFRRLMLRSGSICASQIPYPFKSEPHCEPARDSDIAALNNRVHESLPEWDIVDMVQIFNRALVSKYADYRHRVATRRNGDPNERMLFHYCREEIIPKIWQQGEGHDPRLSVWAEVGKGAYFSEHLIYGYAYKYSLWPSPPSFVVKPEPPLGSTMRVFVTLVSLGNVADMGPGCETCPSPTWDDWKKEFAYQKSDSDLSPKPTRPPAMLLSSEAAQRQHLLDLMQVKNEPRFDSVTSTEGDMANHPASTCKDSSGRRICEIMHPRLKECPNKWGKQYVVFETAASCPMFIVTVSKVRNSPFGLPQLLDSACGVERIHTLGFKATDFKAIGKTVQEMRALGLTALQLKAAQFDAASLISGGYTISDMKIADFQASQFKEAGCSASQLKIAGFAAADLRAAGFQLSDLDSANYDIDELKFAGYQDSELSHVCKILHMFTMQNDNSI